MSFFRYPGGKAKLKTQILDKLKIGTGIEYREPFLGGGSICTEMLQSPSRTFTSVWVNDKDTGIIALWIAVHEYPELLKQAVMDFVPTTTAFYDIRTELLRTDVLPAKKKAIVSLGLKKLAIHQISYSGLGTKSGSPLGGKEQNSQYKVNCRWSPEYICKKIDKMHELFATVKLRITNRDYEALLTDISVSSVIYLDPPYYVKGNDLYQCGFSPADHERLADLLRETNHQWVLSYDDCPEIRELYAWANVQTIHEVQYSITSSRTKPELIILPNASVLEDAEEVTVTPPEAIAA